MNLASDVPPEYVSEALGHLKNKATPLAQPQPQPQPEPAADPEPNRMHLRLVHDEPESAEPTSEPEVAVEDNDDGPDDDGPAPPPKKPFLSVVK